MIGAVVALAAHAADLYLVGASVAPNWTDALSTHWDALNAKTIQFSDGYYYFKAEGAFQVSTVKADWDAGFKSSSLRAETWSTADDNGIKTSTLKTGDESNSNAAFTSGTVYYRIYQSGNNYVMEGAQSMDAFDSSVPSFTNLYLVGEDFGWTFDADHQMTTTDGVVYTKENVSFSQKFLICGNNYSPKYGGCASIQIGENQLILASGNDNNTDNVVLSNVNISFNSSTKVLTIEDNSVYYGLFMTNGTMIGRFDNDGNFTYSIPQSAPLTADIPICVRRVEGSVMTVYRLNAAYTYDCTSVTKPLQENGTPVVLPMGLCGDVNFSITLDEDVPTSISISGGQMSDMSNVYTVYFYDQNNIDGDNLYVHIWTDNNSIFKTWNSKDPLIKMVNTGQYIRRGASLYPLYKLTFTWNHEPDHILIYNGGVGGEKKYTDDAVFVNNGYYTNGSSTAITDLTPVEGTELYLYMHFKEDMIQEALNGEDGIAYCNLLRGDTFINDSRDAAHQMERVSEKYQIYRYKVNPDELVGADNVEFSFQRPDYTWATFRASNAEHFNQNRWTEFIYATAKRDIGAAKDVQYAVQTYLSWEDFRDTDALGRPAIYLVGEGAISDLEWKPAEAKQYVNEDGSCFYIPVTVTGQYTTHFKMSWINAGKFKQGATEGMTDDARDWATFDLGIIGVALRYQYPAGSYTPTIKQYEGQGVRSAVFGVNTSVAYLNYNQYNFTIEGTKLPAQTYYIVIDTHDECRTVTLTDFDPNPTIDAEAGEISTLNLTHEQAEALHLHYNHLNCASSNGHILMDKVNTCSGTLNLHGSSGLAIDDSGYNINYTVDMNGVNVVDYIGKPGAIHLDYLPVSADENITVRAKYTDKERTQKLTPSGEVYRAGRLGTGLTFHSRRATGTVNTPADMTAPDAMIKDAIYAYEPGEGVYGVLMNKVALSVDDEVAQKYSVYGDFSFTFDDPTFDTSRRIQFVHEDHYMSKFASNRITGWTPLAEDGEYDFDSNDWSSKIISSDIDAPIFLSRYTTIAHKADLPAEDVTIEGEAHAIYPFIYELYPTIVVVPESAPSQAAAQAPVKAPARSIPDNMSGFGINNMIMSTPISKTVSADSAVSAVEDVLVDADLTDSEAEYFTLAGVRVQGEPTPGIYLCRKGSNVSKVIVK